MLMRGIAAERRGFFWGLAGVLVGALVAATALMMLPAEGATGDTMILGRANQAGLATKIRSNGASTLKITNTLATGVGIDVTTRPGRPPLRVNSDALVYNLNADEVDGRDASELLPIVKKCSSDNITSANQRWRCRVNFTTQHPGTFVMSGSSDALNSGGVSNYQTCRFRIDGFDLDYSWHPASARPGDYAVCASDAAEGRAAGAHTIDFVVEWGGGLDARKGSMWVMWVPD